MRRSAPKPKAIPAQPLSRPADQPRFRPWQLAMILALVTFALYWPAMRCSFVSFDDPDYVTKNPYVHGGLTWAGVKWAFTTDRAATWGPLLWLSHEFACQLFGLNPWGHHFLNVLLHAVNTALVFLVFQRITRATWRSLALAALFGWHPLRVESVAWVTERKDVLSTLFWMLCLMAYARYVGESTVHSPQSTVRSSKSKVGNCTWVYYCAALIFFALGLMSKPMLVTIPFVMLLLDYWPLQRLCQANASTLSREPSPHPDPLPSHPMGAEREQRSGTLGYPESARRSPILGFNTRTLSRGSFNASTFQSLLIEKIPFFILAAAACVVTFVAQKHGGAVMTIANMPIGARIENALISYCRYLGKTFWPVDLAVFYPLPGHWPEAEVLMAGAFLTGITVLFFLARKTRPYLLTGWLWYLGTLVPVIGLVKVGDQAIADRYTYVPSLGVLVIVIWGAYDLAAGWRHRAIALGTAGLAAAILCLSLTWQQLGYWQDSETLFRHTLKVTENNFVIHKDLSVVLLENGKTDEAISEAQEAVRLKPDYLDGQNCLGNALIEKGRIDEAISQFQEALRLDPNYADTHNNLGDALSKKGRMDEAMSQIQEALRLNPDYADAHYNLGIIYRQKGQIDETISQFQDALRLNPENADAHNDLGSALLKKGQFEEATIQFQEALRLKPNYADAHNNLGNVLFKNGQADQAISEIEEALRLDPNLATAHYNLGLIFRQVGRLDDAISQYDEALRLDPDNVEAHNNLGYAFLQKQQFDEAANEFQEAIKLQPDYAEAHNNLGIALINKGQINEAINQFQEAVQLNPDYTPARNNLDRALKLKSAQPGR